MVIIDIQGHVTANVHATGSKIHMISVGGHLQLHTHNYNNSSQLDMYIIMQAMPIKVPCVYKAVYSM